MVGTGGPFLHTALPSTSHDGQWSAGRCVGHARGMTIDDALPTASDRFGGDPAGDSSAPPARPMPWFLGDAPAPTEEPTDEVGRREMAAAAAQLPFLRVVRHLLDFVGDGCRLTKQGALFAVDRRRIEELCRDPADGWSWRPYGADSRVQEAWNLLIRQGWLTREDGEVRPTSSPLFSSEGTTLTEEGIHAARRLLAAVLEDACPMDRYFVTTDGAERDIWDALLVASGPDGLVLPDHPRDGALIHCFESVDFLVGLLRHPYVRDVPIDRASGHVEDSAIRQLAQTAEALCRLVGCGVVTHGDEEESVARDEYWYADDPPSGRPVRAFRTPALMRGAIALMREGAPG